MGRIALCATHALQTDWKDGAKYDSNACMHTVRRIWHHAIATPPLHHLLPADAKRQPDCRMTQVNGWQEKGNLLRIPWRPEEPICKVKYTYNASLPDELKPATRYFYIHACT